MTKKEQKKARFEELMKEVEANYPIGKNIYLETLEGTELATVVDHDPRSFFVSCSVQLSLTNGRTKTLMFTK